MPNRVIALEITHDNAIGKGKALPDNFEIAFYPNKNNADEKTCLSYKSDISKFLKNALTGPYTAELRFAAPGIRVIFFFYFIILYLSFIATKTKHSFSPIL